MLQLELRQHRDLSCLRREAPDLAVATKVEALRTKTVQLQRKASFNQLGHDKPWVFYSGLL